MKLIDRYVSEVGKRLLVLQGREDIEKELRSTLEDMLEDRAKNEARTIDETMEIELLKEYGSPEKVAAIYNPHPYLIGPRTFPFFLFVLKMVIFGIAIGLTVVTIIQLFTQTPMMGAEFTQILGRGLSNIVSTSIAAFGYVVVAFAIIERTVPDLSFKGEDEKWDPASLAKEPDPDSVSRFELITEIVFTFLALAILNLFPQWLGMFFFSDGEQFFVPLFTDAFFKFVPWINITLIAQIVLDIFLLREAVWTTATRVGKVLIEAASLAITVILIRTPGIFGFTADALANSPFNPEQVKIFQTIGTYTLPIILIIIVVIQGIELVKGLYRLFRISIKAK